ncbi:MAG TPA: hypothetical protein P5044_12090, partial [bacterium]|nr:hypothetical protein [bacterium]
MNSILIFTATVFLSVVMISCGIDTGDTGNTGNSGDSGDSGDSSNTGDTGECKEGELKCSDAKGEVQECVIGKWETKEECIEGYICNENATPISCAHQICFDGAIYCKMGDVYSCSNDGLSEEMIQNCSDTQYCDEGDDPGECRDMVCEPDKIFCETNILKECVDDGSGSAILKDCTTGVCDAALEDCLYNAASQTPVVQSFSIAQQES